jgi:hypothetical protein
VGALFVDDGANNAVHVTQKALLEMHFGYGNRRERAALLIVAIISSHREIFLSILLN